MNIIAFDPTKPVQTRCGKPATIIATDLKSPRYPIAARFIDQSGEEVVSMFRIDGRYTSDDVESVNDLFNTGSRLNVTTFLNVFSDGKVYAFNSRAGADAQASFKVGRLECREVNIDLPMP